MDPGVAVGIGALSKIIGLGLKGWSALGERELGKEDLEALRDLLETTASVLDARKPAAATPDVLQLALIGHSFGRAVARHQEFHGKLLLTDGWRRWLNHADRDREDEIRQRVKFAALSVQALGNDPRGEIAHIAALTASPLATPYYRALWRAFADPGLTIEEAGEHPPLVMSNTARREFERYFLLAYLEGLATPGGSGVDEHLQGLTQYRTTLVRDLLISNLATWGQCHVFGNVPRAAWKDAEIVPFMSLDDVYVEPSGIVEREGKPDPAAPREPLLALVERLTATAAAPTVVVVTADFGSGKSLTARSLARRWAEQFLASSAATSLELPLPVHVRCAEDFPSETVDLELTVRRAWKRQSTALGYAVSDDDPAFAWASSEQHAVYLLDGLDEVALGDQHLKTLFQRLAAKTTRNHRFVIFTRPGALLARKDLGDGVVVVRVQPFDHGQVERWLASWNKLVAGRAAITLDGLRRRSLAEIVQTPILLFMVAFTWAHHASNAEPPSLAEIYEHFFYQIAAGKADADRDQHRPIAKASDELLGALKDAGVLEDDAEHADAMLWLMGRVAWEAHMLEQRHPPQPLTRRHIDNLLHDGDVPIPAAAADMIRLGLVLALQADLHSANHTILFGHLSFREFLVGRHWALQLRRLVRGGGRTDRLIASLLGGRLLSHEGKSFDFLIALVNCAASAVAAPGSTGSVRQRPASPLTWDQADRDRLVRAMQELFDDERQEFGERARTGNKADSSLRNDQRAELREAALAIGSLITGSTGLRASDPLTLRSMLAWFWLQSATPALVIAPGAQLANADLRRAVLLEASFAGANLNGANLAGANLRGANLRGARLRGANLVAAGLSNADFSGADLSGADLNGANARGADFTKANLSGASFNRANLAGANMTSAALIWANLTEANLSETDLHRANLSSANLSDANLIWANLKEANLTEANLGEANLIGADLRGAILRGAALPNAKLAEAVHDETTQWPDANHPPNRRSEDGPTDQGVKLDATIVKTKATRPVAEIQPSDIAIVRQPAK